MFERYTEKARRVIFFARYEASQYGSSHIDSEHLLLGLLREDRAFALDLGLDGDAIRGEIEVGTESRERISTAVEIPLSEDCKRALNFAAAEATRLAHKHVGTEHLWLGILRQERSKGAEILVRHGVELSQLREKIGQQPPDLNRDYPVTRAPIGKAVDVFLEAWRARNAQRLASLFAAHGHFWDVRGELWLTPPQIERGLASHFASAEPTELAPDIRDVKYVTAEVCVVTLIWNPDAEAVKRNALAPRMILVLADAHPGWLIVSAHLALLQPGRSPEKRKR